MSNEIEVGKDFQERMFEKIREQMGELLTPIELKSIVEKAMDKAFFATVVLKGEYGREELKEAEFIKITRDLMREKIAVLMEEWIKEHTEEIKKSIDESLAKGMFELIRQHFESMFYNAFDELRSSIRQKF